MTDFLLANIFILSDRSLFAFESECFDIISKYMRDLGSFYVGVVSSLSATALVAAMSLMSGVLRGISPEESVRSLIVGLYLLLLISAAFVFWSGRRSLIDPMRRLPRFGRWPKVIAGICLAVGVVPLIWVFMPYSIPPLRIHAKNSSKYAVLISDQALFLVKVPQTPASDAIIERGWCQLTWLTEPLQRDKPFLVFPGGSADLRCKILNPNVFRRFIESENMDIEVLLSNGHGYVASATMQLNKHAFERYWLMFEFKDQQGSF